MSATLASTFLTAIAGMIVISGGWLAVQRLWLRQFGQRGDAGEDALAGRSGCHGCNCDPTACERELAPLPDKLKEASGHAP
jgi:hypothetical protein